MKGSSNLLTVLFNLEFAGTTNTGILLLQMVYCLSLNYELVGEKRQSLGHTRVEPGCNFGQTELWCDRRENYGSNAKGSYSPY